ncbi:MAG: hypothetical protein IPM63_01500 [Acidobacteriota bacterium]|nr:MAG: hypothetical protein IPM63_01500 [Acidobacteriota bacterium]
MLAGGSDFSSSPFEGSMVVLRMLAIGSIDNSFHCDGRVRGCPVRLERRCPAAFECQRELTGIKGVKEMAAAEPERSGVSVNATTRMPQSPSPPSSLFQ